jgi:cell division septum initiation protein DivIVA
VQDTAQEMTGKAQEKAHEVAGEAQEKAQEMAGKAQEGVRQQLDDRTTKAGEQVSSTAQDLRSVGEELRKQGKDTPAKLADRAAEQTEKVGTYLKEADADRMLHDVEDFGRQRPWAVLAGGMVLGVAAARFLKASSRSRYQQRSGTTAAAQVSQGTTPLPRRSAVEPVATPPPSTALPGDPAPGTGGMGTPGTAGTGIPAQNSAPATPSPAR